jgi:hypothetical protein
MTRLVLGGYGQSDWPADRMVLKVSFDSFSCTKYNTFVIYSY